MSSDMMCTVMPAPSVLSWDGLGYPSIMASGSVHFPLSSNTYILWCLKAMEDLTLTLGGI